MKSELLVTIKNREPENKKQVRQFFDCPDGKYKYTRERADKRSNQQNAYYWACVVPLVKEGLRHNGYDDVKTNEDAHEILKYLFLRKQIASKETGEVLETTGTTTKLNKEMFGEFLERVWKWASEYLGIAIPGPGEPTILPFKI